MRFTVIFLGTLGLVLAVVAAANYIVNPYRIYAPQLFVPVSANDLDSTLRELEDATVSPQTVVLGSSRSWVLLPADLECFSQLASANNAYSSATPGGYFALASYIVENKPAPKFLLVGVDIEAFESNAKFADKMRAVPRLQRYLLGSDRLASFWLNTTNLFSLAQLNDSARIVQTQIMMLPTPAPLMGAEKKKAAKEAKGQTTTGAGAQSAPIPSKATPKPTKVPIPAAIQNAAEGNAERVIRTYLARFGNYKQLSEQEQEYFEALLQLAQQHNIHVKLFISTMHPRLIGALNRQGYYPKRKQEVVQWLRGLQTKYPFEFYDFSTPEAFGGNTKDFYNLAHIDATNSRRLIGALFQEMGRAQECGVKE